MEYGFRGELAVGLNKLWGFRLLIHSVTTREPGSVAFRDVFCSAWQARRKCQLIVIITVTVLCQVLCWHYLFSTTAPSEIIIIYCCLLGEYGETEAEADTQAPEEEAMGAGRSQLLEGT
jgi:hypothetical protein